MPPLAVLYQNGEKCNGLADVYWVSSFAKKSLFDSPSDMQKRYSAHISLATQLEDSGLVDEAGVHFRAAGTLQPHRADLLLRNALMVPVLYDSDVHLRETRARLEGQITSLLRSNLTLDSLDQISMPGTFYIVYQGRNDVAVMTGIQRLYRQMYPALEADSLVASAPNIAGSASVSSRRIRVGFVSSYFRKHSVCKLICGVIRNLNRSTFEVIMFSAAEKHDGMTKWASKQSELVGLPRGVLLSNRNLALERNLDILVFTDLGMDTKTSMWAATRLAAVQICFWGHPTTTGMPSMDYFVTADNFEADTHSSRFSEQLIRFDSPSFFFRYPKLESAPESKEWRFLSRSAIYLVPQTLPKFHPSFDDVLEGILARDASDSAVVIIFNRDKVFWKNRLRRRLAARLDDALLQRVIFVPSVPTNEFQYIVQVSTVLLDPYPFGGGVTSLEAFALCKTVVTAPGLQTVPALTAGMYAHMGMTDLIAQSRAEFVDLALRVRSDLAWRGALEEEICRKNSVLYENHSSVREWERFLSFAAASSDTTSQ